MIKKFNEYSLNESKQVNEIQAWNSHKGDGEVGGSYDQIVSDVENYIAENELDAEVLLEKAAPSIIVYLKKSNKCFNSDNIDNFLSGMIGRSKGEGLNECGFCGNYTLLEEIGEQVSVVSAITGSIEELSGRHHRTYLYDDKIVMEFDLDEIFPEDEE